MTSRGSALVAALWLLTTLAVVASLGLAELAGSAGVARNRIGLARAEWAREGCMAIVAARYGRWAEERSGNGALEVTELRRVLTLDSIALTPNMWCAVSVTDAGAVLAAGESAGDAARCPSDRPVNVNTAPAEVLQCIPGVGEPEAALLLRVRLGRGSFGSLDEVASTLSLSGSVAPAGGFAQALADRAALSPPWLLIRAVGYAGTPPLSAAVTVAAGYQGLRLDIRLREAE